MPVRPWAPVATSRPRIWCISWCDSGIDVDVDLIGRDRCGQVAKRLVGHELPSALLRAGDRKL